MVNKEGKMVEEELVARVAELERAAQRLDRRILRLEGGVLPRAATAPRPCAPIPPPAPEPAVPEPAMPEPARPEPSVPRPVRPAVSLSDLLGRRILGWIGGMALLVGIALFLGLAISRGWIGPEARVILAGITSVLGMAGGVWLYERHGRTEAAAIAVGVATAGQWATVVVAVDLYRLLAPVPGVLVALATAAAASLLAVRWAGRPIAALGLIGGLLSPLALGVAGHTAAIAILGVAAVGVVAVCSWQRWRWITTAAVAVCVPQWIFWLGQDQSVGLSLVVLVWFTLLGLGAAVVGRSGRAVATTAVLTALTSALGAMGLWATTSRGAAGLWLAAVALAFAIWGRGAPRRLRMPEPLAALMTGLAVALADGALALVLSGLWLTAAWGVCALAWAWLVRRDQHGPLAQVGLGAHVALTLMRALQASVGAGHGDLVAILSLAVLAGSCLAGGAATGRRAEVWSGVLHALGLLATACLTALTLGGVALVGAWCAEALVLAQLSRGGEDQLAGVGALGFLGLAVAHTLAVEAKPTGLVIGVPDLASAATAVAAIAAVTLRAGLIARVAQARLALLAGSLGAVLYLGSVALITAFQPAPGTVDDTVLDLGVRQQGQVLLSGAWSLLGVAVLVAGLRGNRAPLRTLGLGILLVAVGKVFLYDLSTLTSIYRVLSLVGIGVLCLGGAFAYQRLRPAPLPDLRATAPVQR